MNWAGESLDQQDYLRDHKIIAICRAQAIESAIQRGTATNGCRLGMMSRGGIDARLVREDRNEEVEPMKRNGYGYCPSWISFGATSSSGRGCHE